MSKWIYKVLYATGMIMLLCFIGMTAIWYNLVLWPMHKLDRCLVTNDVHGILFVDSGGRRFEYELASIDGNPVKWPKFALVQDTLVYWSGDDSALAKISAKSKKIEWFHLPSGIPFKETYVSRVSTDGRFVAVNFGTNGSSDRSAMLLDTDSGRWMCPEGVKLIRLDAEGSGRAAELHTDGTVTLRDLSRRGKGAEIAKLSNVRDFDCDFGTRTLYVIRDNLGEYSIISNNGSITRVKNPWCGLAIFWQSRHKEVWVPGNGAFSMYKSPAFSASGKFLGALGADLPGFYAMEADSGSKHLLDSRFTHSGN